MNALETGVCKVPSFLARPSHGGWQPRIGMLSTICRPATATTSLPGPFDLRFAQRSGITYMGSAFRSAGVFYRGNPRTDYVDSDNYDSIYDHPENSI